MVCGSPETAAESSSLGRAVSIASCRKANRSSYQERRGRSVRTVRKRKYQPGKLFTEPLEPGSEDTEGSQTRALPPGSRGRWPRATRIADLIEGGVEAWPAGSGAQAADCLPEGDPAAAERRRHLGWPAGICDQEEEPQDSCSFA